ncbi:MAG: rhomboid family intramembrane serine protease [Prevotella sp.]|nr:rhomboid family intramembrane serine protease [Prevotella sp.]
MFNIPRITKNLLILNVLAFVAMMVMGATRGGTDLNDIFGLHFFLASDFHIWQLLTYMFMYANIEHIFFNMFALWMFGCVVERAWGEKKFLFYYLVCGVGAGLMQELVQYVWLSSQLGNLSAIPAAVFNPYTTVGASGAVYGILLAFGMTFPEERIFIFPLPIPIKAKWFVCIYAAIELFSAMATPGDNVAHFAHLGGMLFGYLLIRYWRRHPDSYYNTAGTDAFFEKMRQRWENKNGTPSARQRNETQRETDWEYNARMKREQEEIDVILDKIRKSGYDSLTREEKQKLFDRKNQN